MVKSGDRLEQREVDLTLLIALQVHDGDAVAIGLGDVQQFLAVAADDHIGRRMSVADVEVRVEEVSQVGRAQQRQGSRVAIGLSEHRNRRGLWVRARRASDRHKETLRSVGASGAEAGNLAAGVGGVGELVLRDAPIGNEHGVAVLAYRD